MKKATSLLTCLNFPFAIGTTLVGSFTPMLSQRKSSDFPYNPQRLFLFSNEEGETDYLFQFNKKKKYIDENKLRSALVKVVRGKLKDKGEVENGKIYYKISEDGVVKTVILRGVKNHFFDYLNFQLK